MKSSTLPQIVTTAPPTYAAYPTNGGPLHAARPKLGQWFAEPKWNGWCLLVHAPSMAAFNGHTLEPSTIAHEFRPALEKLSRLPFGWVQVEALERRHNLGRGTLVIVDTIPDQPETYLERRIYLEMVAAIQPTQLPIWKELSQPVPEDSLILTPSYQIEERPPHLRKSATSADEILPPGDGAQKLYTILKMCNEQAFGGVEFYEGIVMKKASALYPCQLRKAKEKNGVMMKHRWRW